MRLSRDKVNIAGPRRFRRSQADGRSGVPRRSATPSARKHVRFWKSLLNQEAKIDLAARQKIDTQKRTILEGSQEWDILYRKYYNEEVKKLGVYGPPLYATSTQKR